jgi:hypothetical protein
LSTAADVVGSGTAGLAFWARATVASAVKDATIEAAVRIRIVGCIGAGISCR